MYSDRLRAEYAQARRFRVLENLRLNKMFWSITAAFALVAAVAGIVDRKMYDGLFPKDYLPGAFSQDLLTVLVCVS
jgi:hypothetical protein